ncbi:MAG: hypothetical protein R3F14_25170 [Polyangiaceae bacterium]
MRELATWRGLGFARWDRRVLVISRETLDRIDAGLWSADPIDTDDAALAGLRPPQVEMLVWIALASPYADVPRLCAASGQARFRVEADIAQLVQKRLVTRRAGGLLELSFNLAPGALWQGDRLRSAQAAVAAVLPSSTPRKLLFLHQSSGTSAPERLAIGEEASALAERCIDDGHPEHALAVVEYGLRGLGDEPPPELAGVAVRLLGLGVEAAVAVGTALALDRALLWLRRVEPQTEEIAALSSVLLAALALDQFDDRSFRLVEQVPPFADERMERVRQILRVNAARRTQDPKLEEAVLDEVQAAAGSDPEHTAMLLNYRGRLRYVQGRFREAADLHALAEETARTGLTRAYSRNRRALTLVELFALDEAMELLQEEGEALLLSVRHPVNEAWFSWVSRTVRYRRGEALQPDLDLVSAVASVEESQSAGSVLFCEAAIAWRAQSELAVPITQTALKVLAGAASGPAALLLRCLLVALGKQTSPAEMAELVLASRGPLPPGIGIQALGLLAMGVTGRASGNPPVRLSAEELAALIDPVPPDFRPWRMDILSIDEAVQAIERAWPAPRG